jgi:hypothetical protein
MGKQSIYPKAWDKPWENQTQFISRLMIFKLCGLNNNKMKQLLIKKVSALPEFDLQYSKTASQHATNSIMLTPLSVCLF